MPITVDADQHSLFLGVLTIGVNQVQTLRLTIEFKKTTAFPRRFDNLRHIHLNGVEFLQQACAGAG
jgi:hypothetical protein